MTESQALNDIINDLIKTVDRQKAALADLRDECERHIQAVHERDLIIRDLQRDIETLRAPR